MALRGDAKTRAPLEVPRPAIAGYYGLMMRASVWCAVAMLVLGCESGEEPLRGAKSGLEPILPPSAKETPRQPVDAPRPEAFAPDVEEPQDEATEEEERDLAAELKAAIGTPTECLTDFSVSSPTKLRISVSATVRPTGMVITPSAYATGISTRARQCIERRVGTVVLPALEEPVSQAVSTIVEVDYQPPVIVEADPGVPEPRLKNVREPLPKRPEVAPSGRAIQEPTSTWITGGFDGGRPIEGGKAKKIKGPKPRPIDGYDVDENAQEWSNK